MGKWVAVTIALFAVAAISSAQDSVEAIIQRSVEVSAIDWKAAPSYDYFERDRLPGGGTKTFENLMISGSPYQRLVAMNGQPLSPAQQADEQRKLEAVIVQRRNESEYERAERIAKYEKERNRDHVLMEQLTRAFTFSLVGEQKRDAEDVYVLKAVPRPDYQPPSLETEALRGMQGKLWIDKNTFQWVKVEAQVIHPVSIAGFLAEVEPGTRFELEKMPVENSIWLPRHYAMKANAKVLFLFRHRSQEDETYYGYRKRAPLEELAGRE